MVFKKTVPIRKVAFRIGEFQYRCVLGIQGSYARHEILDLRSEGTRISPYRAADRAGDTRQFFPPAQMLCRHRTDKQQKIASRPRVDFRPRHTPQIAHESHHKRLRAAIGHKHVATSGKNDERDLFFSRPLERFLYLAFRPNVHEVARRAADLKGGRGSERKVLLYLNHGSSFEVST